LLIYILTLYIFRYPLVAQELICHSSVIAEALIEGGYTN